MPASKEWIDQFHIGGGAPCLDCACGYAHIAVESVDLDDEVKEKYQHLSKEELEKQKVVLHYNVDCVTDTICFGHHYVDQCHCDGLAKAEQIILQEETAILNYFYQRNLRLQREAADVLAKLQLPALSNVK